MSNLRVTEGAVLVGTGRTELHVARKQRVPPVTVSHVDSCHHGQSVLCMGQDSKKALEALSTYYMQLIQRLPGSSVKRELKAEDLVSSATSSVCVTGILTSMPDLVEQSDTMQWELAPIDNPNSIDSVKSALEHISAPEESEKRRVISLFPKNVPRFTGAYKGALLRVTGDPFKFDTSGAPTSIGLTKIEAPVRPTFPWSGAAKVEPSETISNYRNTPYRMLLVAGTFGNTFVPIRKAIQVAATRGANTLVLCGPFLTLPPAGKDLLVREGITSITYEDQLSSLIDVIEEELQAVNKVRNAVPLGVYLVPSLEDVSSMPVLPQVAFPLGSGEGWCCTSNPTTLEVLPDTEFDRIPIRISVCAAGALDAVNDAMCERWTDRIDRLKRASEAVVSSGLLFPITAIPSTFHNMPELTSLRVSPTPEKVPHMIVTTSKRVQSVACITHSSSADLSSQGDGILFIALATEGREQTEGGLFTFQGVEVTIPDVTAASTQGLGERAVAVVLTIECLVN